MVTGLTETIPGIKAVIKAATLGDRTEIGIKIIKVTGLTVIGIRYADHFSMRH